MAFHLFGNYNKPGPGVSKDEPPKPPFIRFWQIFFRKWTNFIKLNWLFLIPIAVVFALIFLLNMLTTNLYVCLIPVILLSPFYAGLTFVTRNYAREEHAFIFSDFKDAVKNNWKCFLINGTISYAAFLLMYISINFYSSMSSQGWLFSVPLGISVALSVIFIFAQFYIPLMIVTFDLKLKQLYKNGFIFAIVGLWRNLLLLVIFAVLALANYIMLNLMGLTVLISCLLALLFSFSFSSFLINFTVYPLIEKMMIKPYYAKLNGEDVDSENKDDSKESEKFVEPKEEYVFINGKLVKKASNNEAKDFEDKV